VTGEIGTADAPETLLVVPLYSDTAAGDDDDTFSEDNVIFFF
jgi:hypothetical protein